MFQLPLGRRRVAVRDGSHQRAVQGDRTDHGPGTGPDSPVQRLSERRGLLWSAKRVRDGSVDSFLWRGSDGASLVQRIGAILFGGSLAMVGVALIWPGGQWDLASLIQIAVAFCGICLGMRIVWMALPRRWRQGLTGCFW